MARRSRRQMQLPVPNSWGGRRAGAGRRPAPGRPRMGHDRRAKHDARYPVLPTLRGGPGIPSLRSIKLFSAIRQSIARSGDGTFRVLHFSVQQDHLHAIVEADDHLELSKGIRGLAIRIALAVKRITGVGKVWGDRYHARALKTPREVRLAIVYVLFNFRKHQRGPAGVDPRGSGPWSTAGYGPSQLPPNLHRSRQPEPGSQLSAGAAPV